MMMAVSSNRQPHEKHLNFKMLLSDFTFFRLFSIKTDNNRDFAKLLFSMMKKRVVLVLQDLLK